MIMITYQGGEPYSTFLKIVARVRRRREFEENLPGRFSAWVPDTKAVKSTDNDNNTETVFHLNSISSCAFPKQVVPWS